MFQIALAFLAGDALLQNFSQLPSTYLIVFLLIGSGVFYFFAIKYRHFALLIFVVTLGFSYTDWYAKRILDWTLPTAWEAQALQVQGVIASLPISKTTIKQTHFIFAVQKIKFNNQILVGKSLLRLSMQTPLTPLKVGDKWQFWVRLKRIHSSLNPGSFNYETWAFQNGIRATGRVLAKKPQLFLDHKWHRYPINQLRQYLQIKIKNHLPKTHTAPWLFALMIGERGEVDGKDWEILRATGTNHLMAIAGLHIGMLAGMTHFLVSFFWRLNSRLLLWLPAKEAGASAALITAICYAALAGFSIPTQRATLMLAAFILVTLSKHAIASMQAWSLALLIVLLLNPLTILTESFWLSFGTIALIIYAMSNRLSASGWWWKYGRAQWMISLGLIPLTLLLFHHWSLISFFANSIAIPWLEFFILPFCFLAIVFNFSDESFSILLWCADKSLALLWKILSWCSQLHFASFAGVMPSLFLLITTIMAYVILFMPRGMPGRWLGLIWFLPLFFYQAPQPARGEIWLSLLDVGQGLAVVIQTQKHTLLFDAGPRFLNFLDAGEQIVLPFLYQWGIKKVDMLVVSHGDNDHLGGVAAINKAINIQKINSSVPQKILFKKADFCLAGMSWQWDQIDFTFLYPTIETLGLGNDSSCVLRISNGFHQILLTGDIEKFAEKFLLQENAEQLAAQILIAPHHGSKTSALKKFIAAVHPQFVLYATGYKNRYHFPHHSVVKAYEEAKVQQLNTAQTGMIQFKLAKNPQLLAPELFRKIASRYWMKD